jgi:hypothetical protein
MDEGVGRDLPDAPAVQDLRTIEGEQIERVTRAEGDEKAADDHARDVHDEEQRRDVNRIPADPRDRLIIIRGHDAEHTDSKRRSPAKCKPASEEDGQIFLGQVAEAFKLNVHPRFRGFFMENIAPAISPPSGMGENKPANKAVLDWVHEVESLTKPENVFWCDGSKAEHNYLLGEACRQGVLILLNL